MCRGAELLVVKVEGEAVPGEPMLTLEDDAVFWLRLRDAEANDARADG